MEKPVNVRASLTPGNATGLSGFSRTVIRDVVYGPYRSFDARPSRTTGPVIARGPTVTVTPCAGYSFTASSAPSAIHNATCSLIL